MATRSTSAENRSASRVLDVLDLFLANGACYTLKDVSDRLGIPKSTAHGILHEMKRKGYLMLDPADKTYAVSLGLIGRMTATPRIEIVRQRAHRRLERLASSLGETAKLIAYEPTHSVAIDYVDGVGPLKYAVTLGQRWPLHATGGGKLYLAQYDDQTVREVLSERELERVTPQTIVDVDTLVAQIAEVRQRGWARQREEIHEGISGYAAPVVDREGQLLAAIIVMGPTARIDQNEKTIVKALVAEARELSADVGASG